MKVLGNTVSFQNAWFIMNCYMNEHIDELLYECICWINMMIIWCCN